MPKHTDPKLVPAMGDDELAEEFVFWFRVGRNENGLKGQEKQFIRALAAELEKRKLLNLRGRTLQENITKDQPSKKKRIIRDR